MYCPFANLEILTVICLTIEPATIQPHSTQYSRHKTSHNRYELCQLKHWRKQTIEQLSTGKRGFRTLNISLSKQQRLWNLRNLYIVLSPSVIGCCFIQHTSEVEKIGFWKPNIFFQNITTSCNLYITFMLFYFVVYFDTTNSVSVVVNSIVEYSTSTLQNTTISM